MIRWNHSLFITCNIYMHHLKNDAISWTKEKFPYLISRCRTWISDCRWKIWKVFNVMHDVKKNDITHVIDWSMMIQPNVMFVAVFDTMFAIEKLLYFNVVITCIWGFAWELLHELQWKFLINCTHIPKKNVKQRLLVS